MAVVSRKDIATQVTKTLDSRTRLPKKTYILECIKQEFGISKNSKQPMVTRYWQILTPETLRIDGVETTVAGTEMIQYRPLRSNGNKEKNITPETATANALDRYFTDNGLMGLNSETVDQDAGPEDTAEGLKVAAICYGKDKSPTEDPDEPGGKREPIYDPVTGKPLERYENVIGEILGLAKVSTIG
jgi:hypothetical protein